ncbi:MAG: hypothetical protein A3K19_05405 [Lentisphaerae bacterium RIFOXYB12_FULL_65_16]|nr:MAG: hypothetical protein A3K18_15815 [Lentisphaerae bacterium RIFOXYA12_64_32]OGV94328.1 MAG: hypothetical protein A3K19_05405 [Lentisphaerae bacterium RIFOXYB12_FULL_65_16]
MEDIITIVVFLLFGLFGLFKHALEKKRGHPGGPGQPTGRDGGLDDWPELEEVEARPVRPTSARPASPQSPLPAPAPIAKPKPVLTGRAVDPILQEALRKLAAAQARQDAAVAAQPAPVAAAELAAPAPLNPLTQVAEQSLAAGFPAMKSMYMRTPGIGPRRLVSVRAMGVKNLRQGIIMAEILAPPRAFDI